MSDAFNIAEDMNYDDMNENTKIAADLVLGELRNRHPDIDITMTSGKRNKGDGSHHDYGEAFDIVSSAFEGEEGRALRDEYGEIASAYGLIPWDEYNGSGHEADARGENFHVTVPADWAYDESNITALGSVPTDEFFHDRYEHQALPAYPDEFQDVVQRDPITRFAESAQDALLDSGVTSYLRYMWSGLNPDVKGVTIPGFGEVYKPSEEEIKYVKDLMPDDPVAQNYVLCNAYSQDQLFMLAAMKKQDYDRSKRLAMDERMDGWNVAGFMGTLAGGMLDPLNLATMAMGVGEGAIVTKTLARLGTNASKLSMFSQNKLAQLAVEKARQYKPVVSEFMDAHRSARMAARAATGATMMAGDRYMANRYGGFDPNYMSYMTMAAVLGNAFDAVRLAKDNLSFSNPLKNLYGKLNSTETKVLRSAMGLQPTDTIKATARAELKNLNETEVDVTKRKTGAEAKENKAKKDDLKLTGKLTEDNMPSQSTKQVQTTAQNDLQKRLKMKNEEMEELGLRTPTVEEGGKRKTPLSEEDIKKKEDARNRWVLSSEQAKEFASRHVIKLTKRTTSFVVPGTGQFVVIGDRIKTKSQLKKAVADGYTRSRGIVDDIFGKGFVDAILSDEKWNPKGIKNFNDFLDDIDFWHTAKYTQGSAGFYIMARAKRLVKELRGQNRKVSRESLMKWLSWTADEQRWRDNPVHVDPNNGTTYIYDTALYKDNVFNPHTDELYISDQKEVDKVMQASLPSWIPKSVGRGLETWGIFQTVAGVLANSRLGYCRDLADRLFILGRGRANSGAAGKVVAEQNKKYLQARVKPMLNDYYDVRNDWLRKNEYFKFTKQHLMNFDRQVQQCYNAMYAGNTKGLSPKELVWDDSVIKAAKTVHEVRQVCLKIMQEDPYSHGGIHGLESYMDKEWKPLDDEFTRKVDRELLTRMIQYVGDSKTLVNVLYKYAKMAVKRDIVRQQLEMEAQRQFKIEHKKWEDTLFKGKDTRNPKAKGKQKVLPKAYDTAEGHTPKSGNPSQVKGKMPVEFDEYTPVTSSKKPKKDFTEAPKEPQLQQITDEMVDEEIEKRCQDWATGIVDHNESSLVFGGKVGDTDKQFGVGIPSFLRSRLPMDTTTKMPIIGKDGSVIDFDFDTYLRDCRTDQLLTSYIDRVCGEVAAHDALGNWRQNGVLEKLETQLRRAVSEGEISESAANKQRRAIKEGMSRLLSTDLNREPKSVWDAVSYLMRTKSYADVGSTMFLAQLGEFGNAIGYAGARVLTANIPIIRDIRKGMLTATEKEREELATMLELQNWGKNVETRTWDSSSSYEARSFRDALGYTNKIAKTLDNITEAEKIFANIITTANQLPKLTDCMVRQTRISGIIDSIKWANGEKIGGGRTPFSDFFLKAARVHNVEKLKADIKKYIGNKNAKPENLDKWRAENTGTYFEWKNLMENYSNRGIQQMSIGNTPIFKDMNWFTKLLFQFKDYSLRAVNDQTLKALSSRQLDDFLATLFSMGTNILSFVGLVELRNWTKNPNDPDARQKYWDKQISFNRLAWAGVSRGAITGSIPSFGSDLYEVITGTPMMRTTVDNSSRQKPEKTDASAIAGRAVGQMPALSSGIDPVFSVGNTVSDILSDGWSKEDITNIAKLLPMNSFWGLTLATSEIRDAINVPTKKERKEQKQLKKQQQTTPNTTSNSGLTGIMNVK